MAEGTWSIALGFLIFFIAIIFAVVLFVVYRKISLVFFISAIATYIFSVFYAWDVFEFTREFVLLILIFSTILMVLLGKYFSNWEINPPNKVKKEKDKEK